MKKDKIIIGTRGSLLALWQAHELARLLQVPTELKIIKTSGDRFLEVPLQGRLEKGFFTKEIEHHLLTREIDLAVHSLKDLPTEGDSQLTVGAYLKRAAVNDLLLVRPDGHDPARVFPVKEGCATGATALRRQSLLKFYAPQAKAMMLRGNVPTRARKVKEGEFGAIIIARAGVERLKLDVKGLFVYELNAEVWLPAPGQGAIAVEVRAENKYALELLARINDPATRDAVYLERKLLSNFEGGCHTAFGAYARPADNGWKIIVGMEHKDLIWVETTINCSFAECEKHGPKTLTDLQTRPVAKQEDICRPIEL